jgi:dolichol-phosphate mannosyltransferase
VSTTVVVPTYNEVENIALLVPQLLRLPLELKVVVVDDNSPDGTGALADRLALENPGRAEAIHRPAKLGLGTAYLAGFRRALADGASHVLTMDADFSHDPCYIPDLAARCATADLVIGSRYVPRGGAVDSPLMRRLISYGANLAAHVVLGLKARDVTAGFRLYRREVLESVPLDSIRSSGYSFLIEMLFLVEQRRWRVAEVPILFCDRKRGQSKISTQEIGKAMATVGRLAVRRVRGG